MAGLLLAGLATGCSDSGTRIVTIDQPADAGCLRAQEPRTFQIYLVTDVSGSMEAFLTALSREFVTFASGFDQLDPLGRPILVDFYVVAFVNDVKWYGGRMTSAIAVQAALEQAIARGRKNLNLAHDSINADPEENLLDALQSVIDSHPTAEARLVMAATDSAFAEAPAVLSGNIRVASTYANVLAGLKDLGARVHAFAPGQLDGLTRSYDGQPALTSLPGSSVHDLNDLTNASEEIRRTLSFIAREAACN